MRIDYIIVGQGLAGSAIAAQLMQQNQKILVIDNPEENTSSQVAAGLYNPVTGRVMTKTWMADVLFQSLVSFYKKVEEITQTQFLNPMPIYRPFISVEEQNEWMGKSVDASWRPYVLDVVKKATPGGNVNDALGGLLLDQCGYLDTWRYIAAVRKWIAANGIFINDQINYDEIHVDEDGVSYREWRAARIIFCEGAKVKSNPWFSWLPVNSLKGELIIIETERPLDWIINRGVYVVPAGPRRYCVGATYSHTVTQGTTAEAREELEMKLKDLINVPYTIVDQRWGIRPTTPDRRPMVGPHPESDRLLVFNGLGTKGVSLSPYFSEYLIRWLENKDLINNEVDISRYK